MVKWFSNLFKTKTKGELNMSNNVSTSYNGAIVVATEVVQKVNKTINVGTVVTDRKTGEKLEYVGKVSSKKFNCPFVFVAINADPSDGNSRRHSADYVAKYLA